MAYTIGANHTKFWSVDTGVNTRVNSPISVKNSRYGKNNRMPRKTFCGTYMDGVVDFLPVEVTAKSTYGIQILDYACNLLTVIKGHVTRWIFQEFQVAP